MKPDSDDQVIAIAFRRSLAVILIAAVVVGGFLVTRNLMQPEVEPVTEADVISPQVADSSNEPSPPDVQFAVLPGARVAKLLQKLREPVVCCRVFGVQA